MLSDGLDRKKSIVSAGSCHVKCDKRAAQIPDRASSLRDDQLDMSNAKLNETMTRLRSHSRSQPVHIRSSQDTLCEDRQLGRVSYMLQRRVHPASTSLIGGGRAGFCRVHRGSSLKNLWCGSDGGTKLHGSIGLIPNCEELPHATLDNDIQDLLFTSSHASHLTFVFETPTLLRWH